MVPLHLRWQLPDMSAAGGNSSAAGPGSAEIPVGLRIVTGSLRGPIGRQGNRGKHVLSKVRQIERGIGQVLRGLRACARPARDAGARRRRRRRRGRRDRGGGVGGGLRRNCPGLDPGRDRHPGLPGLHRPGAGLGGGRRRRNRQGSRGGILVPPPADPAQPGGGGGLPRAHGVGPQCGDRPGQRDRGGDDGRRAGGGRFAAAGAGTAGGRGHRLDLHERRHRRQAPAGPVQVAWPRRRRRRRGPGRRPPDGLAGEPGLSPLCPPARVAVCWAGLPVRMPRMTRHALALAFACAFVALPAFAQDPPPPPPEPEEQQEQQDEERGDSVELEQDALDAAGVDPAEAPLDSARGLREDADAAEDNGEWSVESTQGQAKTIAFETSEGTWMDVDVSPDGREIVFSLVGDLYRMPAGGGAATRITSGRAWDIQPRWSPDGRRIAFTSDRSGGNNIWTMAADGSDARQVTDESFRLLNNPAWTPDGEYIVARKHFTSRRSLGAGELWLYHAGGTSAGIQLVEKPNEQQDIGEPSVSPDGRYVYYSQDVSPGGAFDYNRDPHGVIYAIKRFDRQTGNIEDVVRSPGGAVRPQVSPDGRSLAFVKRVRDSSVLHHLDLTSGQVRPVWDGLSHDQQEAWAIFGPYTGFDWTPDSRSVVLWAQGGLWRVDMGSGEAEQVPFTARVEQVVSQPLRFAQSLPEGEFSPRMIRDVATSADGGTLVFHALGHLWRKSLPGGTPQRLTGSRGVYEYQPSFSADGRQMLYTTWADEEMGAIHVRGASGTGAGRKITSERGFYYHPRFSPDGSRVVYSRSGGSGLTGSLWSGERGIYVIPSSGGEPVRVADSGQSPQFNHDGSRVLYLDGRGMEKKLMSVGLHGEDPREVFDLKYVDSVQISPDGKWVAFTELFNAYVAPMPEAGRTITLDRETRALPVRQVSADVGSYLHWAADSQSVHWMVGDRYHSRRLDETFAFLPGAPEEIAEPAPGGGIT